MLCPPTIDPPPHGGSVIATTGATSSLGTTSPSEVAEEVVEVAEEAVAAGADFLAVTGVLLAGAAVGALLVWIGTRTVFRLWGSPFALQARRRGRVARRLVGASLGALVALRTLDVAADTDDLLGQGFVLVLVLGLTWSALSLLRAAEAAAIETYDTTGADNLHARRRRTQFLVLRRVGSAAAVIVGLSIALLTFPAARAVGQSLLASAGLLGIVAGVAAQSSLKNLVAGIQIAVAEPIRLGDAVFVEGEWGWIEDITLTMVVVKTWDLRRLIYPTSWFTENSFQNWTRQDAQLLGTVTLVLDHRVDVAALRVATEQAITSNAKWDGSAWILQVTEADEHGITVRALMTSVDAPTTFQLRCDVREDLVAWLVANDPDALPVRRVLQPDLPDDELVARAPDDADGA
jgi:small-conductance mechanosensitive channel